MACRCLYGDVRTTYKYFGLSPREVIIYKLLLPSTTIEEGERVAFVGRGEVKRGKKKGGEMDLTSFW